jgi:hypothetical protein
MFLIIGLVLLVIFSVVGILLFNNSMDFEFAGLMIFAICATFAFLGSLLLLDKWLGYPQQINKFTVQKAYIEQLDHEDMTNTALVLKKIELNDWLISEKYWLENRSNWTIAPKEILELEPIN